MFVIVAYRSSAGLFSVEWLADGSVALSAANGRYVTARMNGSLNAVADAVRTVHCAPTHIHTVTVT